MKLRIMNYELRKIRGFVASMSIAALCSASVMGCSESSTTAGVLTETESGQTATIDENGDKIVNVDGCSTSIPNSLRKNASLQDAEYGTELACISFNRDYAQARVKGSAVDTDGNPLKNTRVLLKRIEGDYDVGNGLSHETSVRETSTDNNGNFVFDDVVYKATYLNIDPIDESFERNEKGQAVVYIRYALMIGSENDSLASYSKLDLKNAERISDDDGKYLEIKPQEIRKTTNLEIQFNKNDFSASEKICLDFSNACHVLTEDELTAGSFLMENIPEGIYQNLCTYVTNAAGTSSEYTNAICKSLSTPVITKESSNSLSFVIPETALALLDSFSNKTLDKVLVQYSFDKDISVPILVNGNSISKSTFIESNGRENRYWAEINLNAQDTATYNIVDASDLGISSNIFVAQSSAQDTVIDKGHYERKNIGYSFKIKVDGSNENYESAFISVLDSIGDEKKLTIGYEIGQCETDPKSICSRIYSGLDGSVTDTTIYGKAAILDGGEHIYSIAFVGVHLTIAVDGKIIRDTDLKVNDHFGSWINSSPIVIGDAKLRDFVVFKIDEGIKQERDNNWNRLKAWLIAFQELQK